MLQLVLLLMQIADGMVHNVLIGDAQHLQPQIQPQLNVNLLTQVIIVFQPIQSVEMLLVVLICQLLVVLERLKIIVKSPVPQELQNVSGI